MLWQLAFMARVMQYSLTSIWDRHHAFPRVTLMTSCSMPVPINFYMQLVKDAPGKSLPQLPDMPFLTLS